MAEAKIDDDGIVKNVPVTVRCKLTIKGDEATFDFSDSDPQQRGYINAVYSVTFSDTLAAAFMFLGKEISAYHNEGSLKPIHVVTKEETVVHCKPGALVAVSGAVTGAVIIESVISALSKALPERAMGCYGRLCAPGIRIGKDPRTNELYVYVTFGPHGGAGAVYGYDGYQCCCNMGAMGVVCKSDIEEEMVRFPWRVTTYEFLTDSCGPGKWRGAPGIIWEGINEGSAGECHGGASQGFNVPGQGQQGGYPTPLNKACLVRDGKKRELTYPRHIDILPSDVIISKSGGGAGVGSPEERDPEAVRMDVKNELVSLGAARDIYRVALDPVTLEIDVQETKTLRR
jgi:N-methylhydantoinase B